MSLSGKDNKKPDNRGKAIDNEIKNYQMEKEYNPNSDLDINQYKTPALQGKLELNPDLEAK